MFESFKDAVTRFHTALEQLIIDVRLEQAGIPLEFYFDTSDVQQAALGMQAFYEPIEGWKLDRFHKPAALVEALLASGRLGAFGLLPPHQAEFLDRLKQRFDTETRESGRAKAGDFLEQIGVGRPGGRARNFDEMSEEEVRQFIHRQAGKADIFYKAVHFINGNWFTRVLRWRECGLLQSRKHSVDYGALLSSRDFGALQEAFKQQRPTLSINNFTDAAALTTLIALTRRAELEQGSPHPRFFLSTSAFRKAVTSAGVRDRLVLRAPGLEQTSVLREAEYFILRATFRAPEAHASQDIRQLESDLSDLRRIIDNFAAEEIATDLSSPPVVLERYARSLREFKSFSFLENVWLPTVSEKDLREQLALLDDDARRVSDPKLAMQLREQHRRIKDEFARDSEDFRFALRLLTGLQRYYERVPRSLRLAAATGLDLVAYHGLFRFSLPLDAQQLIREHLRNLVSDDEAVRSHVFQWLQDILNTPSGGGADREAELAAAAAVLWVAEVDDALERLLQSEQSRSLPSLRIVYAAAAVRRRQTGRAYAEIQALEEALRCAAAREQAFLAVGLSYLYFHLWENRFGGRPLEEPVAKAEGLAQARELFAVRAIDYASIAYEALLELTPELFEDTTTSEALLQRPLREDEEAVSALRILESYALNLRLYYMLETQPKLNLQQAHKDAQTLQGYRRVPGCWQFRYDDTLARFYRRLAALDRRMENRLSMLNQAIEYAEEAWSEAHGNSIVRDLLRSLQLEVSAVDAELATMM